VLVPAIAWWSGKSLLNEATGLGLLRIAIAFVGPRARVDCDGATGQKIGSQIAFPVR